jgi:predicted nucleic acid-binding protein
VCATPSSEEEKLWLRSGSPLLPLDLAAAKIYADLWANLQKRRQQIGSHDVMIAATALSLGYSPATLDLPDYERIEELTVEPLG